MSAPRIATALAVTFLAALVGCRSTPETPTRFVLVTIDTLRADHLGAYGYPRRVSPFFDDLATRSARFENAYSASSHTMPSHATMFTGLFPAQHNTLENGHPLHEGLLTMAQVFQQRGYATAGFSTANFLAPLGRGFDHFSPHRGHNAAPVLVDEAIAWLDSLASDQPFFLWLHLFDVHQWYQPEHLDPTDEAAAAASADLSEDELVELWQTQHGSELPVWEDRDELLQAMNRYDGQILLVDRTLRRFYEELRSRQLLAGSHWIVTADHGEGLGSHGTRGHGMKIYNEQIRIPLLWHVPDGRWADTIVKPLVRTVDLLPTVAELLGASLEEQRFPVAGRSLIPLLDGRLRDGDRRYAYAQRRDPDERRLRRGWEPGKIVSLQDLRTKLILHEEGDDELYDLVADPLEQVNLLSGEAPEDDHLRTTLERMVAAMTAQGESLGDQEIAAEFVEELRALGYL